MISMTHGDNTLAMSICPCGILTPRVHCRLNYTITHRKPVNNIREVKSIRGFLSDHIFVYDNVGIQVVTRVSGYWKLNPHLLFDNEHRLDS